MSFDFGSLTGPLGGIIAVAYGAGAASGYAFCLRTMYKILKSQAEKDELECSHRLDEANEKIARLENRCEQLSERLLGGMERQHAQVRESGQILLEREKKKRTEG